MPALVPPLNHRQLKNHMSDYYWHNIGKPYKQSWWDYLRNHGLITTGFGNTEGDRGEEILTGYRKTDFVIAYANGFGALAVGRPDPHSYKLVDAVDVPSAFESNHRHWLSVEWICGVESLSDAVTFHEFQSSFGLYYPRPTSVVINETSAAEGLAGRLREISDLTVEATLPEELTNVGQFVEGAKRSITVNAYERNKKARQACIDYYGYQCVVCNFNFEEIYGSVGEGYIHVHHIKPLSEVDSEYEVDPIADLRPVCPNCHSMIHRRSDPYEIAEVVAMIDGKH
jgi:hypothetical protein